MEKLGLSAILTSIISYGICILWQHLEIYFYGEIQYRNVDDIIMLIVMVILLFAIYFALSYFERR